MQNIFKLKSFWLAAAAITIAVFFALIGANKNYQSQASVLIIPKSQTAIQNANQIVENLKTLPNLPYFQNKISASGAEIKAERIGKSGIIKITVLGKNKSEAQILGDRAVKTLITETSRYYNIKNDIDIRILGESTIRYSAENYIWFLFLVSLPIGLVLSFLFFYFIPRFEERKIEFKLGLPKFNLKNIPTKPEQKKENQPFFEQDFNFSSIKKAAAPANLPISEEKEEVKQEKKAPIIREATPEEVKERLNKLLSGRL